MIRAVYFDAVGTVIHPEPSVAETYQRVAAAHGCVLPIGEIKRRMAEQYAIQESIDRSHEWQTSEDREFERWSAVVAGTFREFPQREAVFRELHYWFSLPSAWRVSPELPATSSMLFDRGIPIGLASNFDGRLRGIVEGRAELHPFRDRLLISSEIGHRKPGRRFFEAVIANAGVEPHQILFVGDDEQNDIVGSRAVGLQPHFVLSDDPNMGIGIASIIDSRMGEDP